MKLRASCWFLAAAAPYALAVLVSPRPPGPDFQRDILPVLKANCLSCHEGPKAQGGLDLSTVAGIRKAVVAGQSLKSPLVRRIMGLDGKPRMPMGFAPLPDSKIAAIRSWIDAGAKGLSAISFAKDILPVFKAHCSSCHSGNAPTANLNLMSASGVLRTVIAGNSKGSELLKRLRGEGGKQQMPKGFIPLSSATIAKIAEWVDDGALIDSSATPSHWAFVAPKKPALPTASNPKWLRNPIDSFIMQRLDKEGLKPSKPADKATLLRRLSLDLIGLPPTPQELDAFLNDKTPNAYEKVVERLLASPHYGERQSRPWLDLARYADSHGYEKDAGRVMWKYRDWVIDAFNKNMPYDRFTVHQIAGDLLPTPTLDQLVATGFHRNTMFNQEGGVDQDEARFEVMVDRVGTTGTVWLGLTVACARCHDHKYDPVKQKDFYSMLAFFANTDYEARGDKNVSAQNYFEPEIAVPSAEQSATRKTLQAEIARAQAQIAKPNAADIATWRKAIAEGVTWSQGVSQNWTSETGTTFSKDGPAYRASGGGVNDTYTATIKLDPGTYHAVRLDVLPDDSLPLKGPGRADSGNFILSKVTSKQKFAQAAADYVQGGYNIMGCFDDNVETGWAVYSEIGKPHTAVFTFERPLTINETSDFTVNFEQKSARWPMHTIGKFALSITSDAHALASAAPEPIRMIAAKEARTESEQKQLEQFIAGLSPLNQRVASLQAELAQLEAQIPRAQIISEKNANAEHKAPVRIRGEFTNPGELVNASTPAFMSPMPSALKKNRLGLAKWLASKNNPLTARVQVNRMWEQYFGRGIVETSENFGTQCSPPTHPELLDWLATEFMRRNWDMKAIHRLIVTSATYRQSSNTTKELLKKDPNNELLARGPRFRMEAEMLRDNALAASGLLNKSIGGPSVYPAQPEGVWDSPFSGETWMTSKGADRYRRGLYTYMKRTAPFPAFMTFDGTSRESCTVRRIRTNTPLQALNLLNDEQYMEAARALAKRVSWQKQPEKQATIAFRCCTSRYPSQTERQRLTKLYNDLVSKRAMPPKEAMTMVCSVILNLDETITKN